MTQRTRWTRYGLLVVTVTALVHAGCGRKSAAVEDAQEDARTGPHGGAMVELTPAAIREVGIVTGTAGPRPIEVTLELPGEIKVNAEHAVDVRPTYAGQVVALDAAPGARVSRGQRLAVIHSRESLSDYALTSPMGGTIVGRPASRGASIEPGDVLYAVADLSSVWLEFPVYLKDLARVRRGQAVRVRVEGGPEEAGSSRVSYVAPVLDTATRSTVARAVLPNADGRWQPGRLVTAVVVLERSTVPVAVPDEAIVRLGTGAAVFRADSSGFEVQPVTTGRSDGTTTEIVSGLERGARVVMQNAFWLKAELEKEAGGDED